MKRIIVIAPVAIPKSAAITTSSIHAEVTRTSIWSAFGCALLFAFGQAAAATLTGQVVGVSDGDTITVLDALHQQFKIRLSGIDAPEKKQPFGQRSKQNLSALVFGREVDVVWNKRDRYQRIVGKVMVVSPGCAQSSCPRTNDAGLRQIEAGMAWWYRQYAREQTPGDAAAYEHAELQARSRRIGLWSEPNPVPPWEWRRARLKLGGR